MHKNKYGINEYGYPAPMHLCDKEVDFPVKKKSKVTRLKIYLYKLYKSLKG